MNWARPASPGVLQFPDPPMVVTPPRRALPFKPGAARRLGLRRPFSKDDRALDDRINAAVAAWSWTGLR